VITDNNYDNIHTIPEQESTRAWNYRNYHIERCERTADSNNNNNNLLLVDIDDVRVLAKEVTNLVL